MRKYKQIQCVPWDTTDGKLRGGIVTLTPEAGAYLLTECNETNRPMSLKVLGKYSYDALQGKFELTPQPVLLGDDGHILDGQHRTAIPVVSGVSVKVLMFTNVPTIHKDPMGNEFKIQSLLDEGHTKKVAEMLAERGIPAARRVATAITGLVAQLYTSYPMSLAKALDIIDIFPEQFDLLAKWQLPDICDSSPVLAALVLEHRAFPEETQRFVDALINSGAANNSSQALVSAPQALINKLSAGNIRASGGKRPAIFKVTLKAFDLFRHGRALKTQDLRIPWGQFPLGRSLLKRLETEVEALRSLFKPVDLEAQLAALGKNEMKTVRKEKTAWDYEVRTITPEFSARAIESIGDVPVTLRIKRYAADILASRFALTFEPIIVDADLHVFPGAGVKRLRACILSRTPFPALLVMADELSPNFGAGYRRTFKNQLGIEKRSLQQAPALQAISRILLGPDGHQGLSATSCAVLSECFGESINRMFDLAKEADATGPIRTGGVMGSLAMVHKAFPKKFEKLAGRLFSAEESQDGTPLCKIWEQINTEGAFTTIESQRKLVRSLVELVLDETNIPVETAMQRLREANEDFGRAEKVLNQRREAIAALDVLLAKRAQAEEEPDEK